MKKSKSRLEAARRLQAKPQLDRDAVLTAGLGLAALVAQEAHAGEREALQAGTRAISESDLVAALTGADDASIAASVQDAPAVGADDPAAVLDQAFHAAVQAMEPIQVAGLDAAALSDVAGAAALPFAAEAVMADAAQAQPADAAGGAEAQAAAASTDTVASAADVDPNALLAAQPTAFGLLAPFAPLAAVGAAAGAAAAGSSTGGGATAATALSGKVVDGNVANATIFYDANGNGKLDNGEVSAVTGSDGSFTLTGYTATSTGRLVVLAGGTDTLTGQTVGSMFAPVGYTSVNPLTTLLAASGLSESELLSKLGLTGLNLNTYDPVASMRSGDAAAVALAEKAFTISQQIYAVLESVAALSASVSGAASVGLGDVTTIAKAIANGLMSSTSTDFSAALSQATTAALSASGADAATQSALSSALATVTAAIATNYSGLAAALQSGSAEAIAAKVDIAAIAQNTLVSYAASGNLAGLTALSDPATLAKLENTYASSITSGNHLPTFSGQLTGSLTQNDSAATLSAKGAVTVTDSDGASQSAINVLAGVTAASGTLGSLSIDASGNWTYSVASSKLVYLDATQTKIESFTVQSVDGTPVIIQLTITGTNDAFTVSVADEQAVAAAGQKYGAGHTVTLAASTTELTSGILSVSALQALGVDAVTGTSGAAAAATVQLGSGVDWSAALPTFDASTVVTLDVTSAQLGDALSHAGQLHAAGVDVLSVGGGTLNLTSSQLEGAINAGLSFAAADTVVLSDTGANISAELASLNASQITALTSSHVDLIDANDNSVVLSDVAAQHAIQAGLHFAAGDSVAVHAAGTVLNSSVAALQALGVDTVSGATDSSALHLSLGTVDWNGSLPSFASGLSVTLDVSSSQVADALNHASQLHGAGIDTLSVGGGELDLSASQLNSALSAGLNFAAADTVVLSDTGSNIASELASLSASQVTSLASSHVDLVDATNDTVTLSDVAAQHAIQAGLHFAAGDAVAVHAAGTVLNSSVAALQALGVDTVSGAASLSLALGTGVNWSASLPQFDAALAVTLDVSSAQVADVLNHASQLHAAGIDTLAVDGGSVSITATEALQAANAGLAFAAADTVVLADTGAHLSAGLESLSATQLTSLQAAHIDSVALTDHSIALSDLGAQHAIDLGLHFAASDAVALHASGTVLHTSIHDLQQLGVDTVDTTASKLTVSLGDSSVTLDQVAHGTLPTFDSTHADINLVVQQSQLVGSSLADIAALKASGIDAIEVQGSTTTLASTAVSGTGNGTSTVFLNETLTETQHTTISGDTYSAFEVTDELAKVLIDAGLITAPNATSTDVVTLDIAASSGESVMSLIMMGEFHVQHVNVSAADTSGDVLIHLGEDPTTHQDADLADLISTLSKLGTQDIFSANEHATLDLGAGISFGELHAEELLQLKQLGFESVLTHDGVSHSLTGK